MSETAVAPSTAASGEAPQSDFNAVNFGDPPAEAPAPAAPPAEPAVAPPPVEEPANQDIRILTLENGEKEVRLSSGEVFRGKDDAEIIQNIAKGKLEATRHIQTLRQQTKPQEIPQQAPPDDQTANALFELIAPALKPYMATIEEFRNQQTAAQFYQEIPDGPRMKANTDKLGEFLDERKMPFTVENARMAHYYLKGTGQYVAETPIPRTETGQFAPRTANTMPAPPSTTAATPAAVPDIWSMTDAEFDAYRAKGGR